jgi:D-alanyl-D-alanine carboxypeptidase/D-alanyl-D-alanine-endopeptidase (penicillin-binding protein 4)
MNASIAKRYNLGQAQTFSLIRACDQRPGGGRYADLGIQRKARVNVRNQLRALVVVAVTLVPVVVVPSAVAGSATVALDVSARIVTYGQDVTVSGAVTGDPNCAGDRPILLQWRPADSAGYATVAEGTTTAEGAFSFVQSQPHSGRYRALLPAESVCIQAKSDDVLVRVRVFVDASLVAGSSQAGSCVDVTVIVSPDKPGHVVELLRRAGGTWTPVEALTLDAASSARTQPCVGWDDIGVVRLRVRWVSQDTLNETSSSPTLAFEVTEADWMRRIDDILGRRAISVSVAEDDAFLYRHADQTPRTPASNEKLLLAMASLDAFGLEHRIPTLAAAEAFKGGVVRGDLWILGRGDPLVGRASLAALADQLVDAGVERVSGGVVGATNFFLQDWNAPGWNDVARDYVNRPTALTFEGNHESNPERQAAAALTTLLERRDVRVADGPGAGTPPDGLQVLAEIDSRALATLLEMMLRPSWNFAAEVLGKGLGAGVRGAPGTIAKGAATIQAWAAGRGVQLTAFDSSGLSYDNRVTAAGLVELLGQAEDESWGDELRNALPSGGQGTLEHRLHGVRVRAKTGSLEDVSTLSGWVYSRRLDAWIEFSILCQGMPKSTASEIEDRVVRILEDHAR